MEVFFFLLFFLSFFFLGWAFSGLFFIPMAFTYALVGFVSEIHFMLNIRVYFSFLCPHYVWFFRKGLDTIIIRRDNLLSRIKKKVFANLKKLQNLPNLLHIIIVFCNYICVVLPPNLGCLWYVYSTCKNICTVHTYISSHTCVIERWLVVYVTY